MSFFFFDFLFFIGTWWENTDPTLAACGIYEDWPCGRGGATCTNNETEGTTTNTVVQYGGENHLFIAVETTTTSSALQNYKTSFARIKMLHDKLETIAGIEFATTEAYGYATSSVSHLGTGMKANAVIRYQETSQETKNNDPEIKDSQIHKNKNNYTSNNKKLDIFISK